MDPGTDDNELYFIQNSVMSDYSSVISDNTKWSRSPNDHTDDSMNTESWMDNENQGSVEIENGPYLKIIHQPINKFRFRYKSEMQGTHGCLMASTRKSEKTQYPTVELFNFNGPAVISCTLYTDDYKIHAHSLMRAREIDPHYLPVDPKLGYRVIFSEMGIIHTARKNLSEELKRKINKISNSSKHYFMLSNESQEIKESVKKMKLNVVRLAFEAYKKDEEGYLIPICKRIFSNSISNKKSALTGELKICRMNLVAGSARGGDEMILFVEKVMKKNIKVRFFEINNDDNEVWEDFARFNEIDVHHQYAIALRTPPYRDTRITKPVQVYVELYRPSDDDKSEPKSFQYLPQPTVGSKRPRLELNDSLNLSGNIISNGNDLIHCLEQDNRFNSDELQQCLSLLEFENIESLNENLIVHDGTKGAETRENFALRKILTELYNERKAHSPLKPLIDKIFSKVINYNKSALHLAITTDLTKLKFLLEILCHSPNYSKEMIESDVNDHGQNILHMAVKLNLSDVTRILIQTFNINPNIQDYKSNSAFHMIFNLEEADCFIHLRELLMSKYSLFPNVTNKDDSTPVHLAIEKGYIRSLKVLLDLEDAYFPRTTDGCNSLHLSIISKSLEATRTILEMDKTGINFKNELGYTPLFYAVVQKDANLCKLLMEFGANPHITSSIGDSYDSDTSDEENECNETVFQLARNDKNILDILTIAEPKKEKSKVEKKSFIKFDSQCLTELSYIFDKESKWKSLAREFGLQLFVNILKQTESPTLALLNHPELHLSVNDIQNYFQSVHPEAAEVIQKMKDRM